ncbi:MAG: LLM class F420-dependent oxidoreductase [bacterium]|nr:LLM class F420-dependent oxidoreductase [Gammaproteobacteria bacterium]HIL98214.1 LLM class F420-dependent oxidoreductase [Pseudomonadales bacterium]
MKLGLLAGYGGKVINIDIDRIKRAEDIGYDSIWTAEAYGSDAVTPATWILAQTEKIKVGTAIMQMPGRSPACTAMTAMTLNQLSNGRFILGLGASGPQVVEGWHGVPYGKPVTRIKEYVSIVKQIMAREAPVEHQGVHYSLPYTGEDGTGLGKPLKSILQADTSIPIYTASITPRGLAGSAEVADGVFPIWMSPERFDVLQGPIQKGLDKAGKTMLDYDVAPFITCIIGDDIDACRMPVKGNMALYIGGMGARDKNFYNDYARALGFEDAAVKIQDLFLAGKKDQAMAAVPDELVDACHLVGPKEHIKERLKAWKQAGIDGHVSSMLIGAGQPEALELIASEIL